jgi:Ca2+/H+ antiporter, TMEM165/GDT1 family
VVLVVVGTSLGMLIANVPAVLLGEVAAKKFNVRLIQRITAAVFAILGIGVLAAG